MKTLVTGAFPLTTEFRKELEQFGMEIVIHPDERTPVDCPDDYVVVICNGLFLYNDISLFKKMKIIQLTSAGYDRVPMDYAEEHHIKVFNAGDAYSIPMAEFAISGILQLYKHAPFFYKNKEDHRWEKHRGLRELYGKNVLIVGTGNVGCEIAKRLKVFGCTVTGLNRTEKNASCFDTVLPLDKMDSVAPSADIIILSIALTKTTKHMIDNDVLCQMKEDAVLVNVSRGGLVDENALFSWLQEHPSAGGIIDVYESEPLSDSNLLWECSNAIITPHNSFVGENNKKRLEQVVLQHFNAAFNYDPTK